MDNIRDSLVANNQFIVTFGGIPFSFSKVTNLSDSVECEYIQEGGVNGAPVFLPKSKGRAEVLRLERGIKTGVAELPAKFLTTGVYVYVVTIIVMKNKKVSKGYFFEEGLITKWEVNELNALGKDVLIRTLEITHTGLHELPF